MSQVGQPQTSSHNPKPAIENISRLGQSQETFQSQESRETSSQEEEEEGEEDEEDEEEDPWMDLLVTSPDGSQSKIETAHITNSSHYGKGDWNINRYGDFIYACRTYHIKATANAMAANFVKPKSEGFKCPKCSFVEPTRATWLYHSSTTCKIANWTELYDRVAMFPIAHVINTNKYVVDSDKSLEEYRMVWGIECPKPDPPKTTKQIKAAQEGTGVPVAWRILRKGLNTTDPYEKEPDDWKMEDQDPYKKTQLDILDCNSYVPLTAYGGNAPYDSGTESVMEGRYVKKSTSLFKMMEHKIRFLRSNPDARPADTAQWPTLVSMPFILPIDKWPSNKKRKKN